MSFTVFDCPGSPVRLKPNRERSVDVNDYAHHRKADQFNTFLSQNRREAARNLWKKVGREFAPRTREELDKGYERNPYHYYMRKFLKINQADNTRAISETKRIDVAVCPKRERDFTNYQFNVNKKPPRPKARGARQKPK